MKFTESHEWIELEGDVATIGVSAHAQKELGDIVYVELPEVGKTLAAKDEACVLESTKAAADVYSPLSGEIIAVNEAVSDAPELVNESPQKDGWLFKIKISQPAELEVLLDEAGYKALVGE